MQTVQQLDHSPLMSNQHTVSHQPDRFIIDFKGIYPQFTPNNKPHMVVSHKVVLLDPYDAKELLKNLETNIKRYEEEFGPIKTPKHIKQAMKQKKKKAKERTREKKKTVKSSDKPSYMG